MKTRFTLCLAVGFWLFVGGISRLNSAQARSFFQTTYTITTTNDSGPGSLRAALEAANLSTEADAILFSVDGTITLASALPPINGQISVDGTGRSVTLDGAGLYRLFEVPAGSSLSLSGIKLANGYTAQDGGAIYNAGELRLTSIVLTNNKARHFGAGMYNAGMLSANDSLFESNGGPWGMPQEGGVLYNAQNGQAVFHNCSFHWNFAHYFGGVFASYGELQIEASKLWRNEALDRGGVIFNRGNAAIYDSVLDDNDTWNYAGTIDTGGSMEIVRSLISHSYSWSGGTIIAGGQLRILNSTLSNNIGDYDGSVLINYGSARLDYTTIAENITNDLDAGGTIINYGSFTIGRSILARNTGGPNCIGSLTAVGPNLTDDNTCPGIPLGDPRLGPLADNGGPSLTHALFAGSPALNSAADPDCPATDQRGMARPQGPGCDLGAFEFKAPELTLQIDIRPKSRQNAIDLQHQTTLPVAVLSTPSFNAPLQVDAASLTFGDLGWESPVLAAQPSGKLLCTASDVSQDGLPDLVCTFNLPAGFTCASQQGWLLGRLRGDSLNGGIRFAGTDAVYPTPCP